MAGARLLARPRGGVGLGRLRPPCGQRALPKRRLLTGGACHSTDPGGGGPPASLPPGLCFRANLHLPGRPRGCAPEPQRLGAPAVRWPGWRGCGSPGEPLRLQEKSGWGEGCTAAVPTKRRGSPGRQPRSDHKTLTPAGHRAVTVEKCGW